jgi:hypothetical protein
VGANGNLIANAQYKAHEAIALLPDESMVALAGVTSEIELLSASDLSLIVRTDYHRGAVYAVAFTTDSKYLLSGDDDETLREFPAAFHFKRLNRRCSGRISRQSPDTRRSLHPTESVVARRNCLRGQPIE